VTIRIDLLDDKEEAIYDELIGSIEHSLLYVTLKYRDFLRRVLPQSRDRYLVAYQAGRMVGTLPAFIKSNATHGNVLNSLPFYGSNGGVQVSPEVGDPEAVKVRLLDAFGDLAAQEGVVASTLISSPLSEDDEIYERHTRYAHKDHRIGQLTLLPQGVDASEVEDSLMARFHKKTRNSIRKAKKSGINIEHSDSRGALNRLADLHRQNIEAMGGIHKPLSVFEDIRQSFSYDRDYRVYIAKKDQAIIGALLVFFHNRTAEYFTPAVDAVFRSDQPGSLLAFEGMLEAVRRGFAYWNWGGTWTTQEGVYRFKSRFGAQDMRYTYYIRELDPSLRQLSRDDILAAYPYFYVLPFGILENACA
jgi:hypothetical protein